MASVYERKRDRARKGSNYYIAYADEAGKRHTIKGCSDKAATEAMARKLESEVALRRRGVVDPRTDAYARHEARPLSDHLADFEAAHKAKGYSADHCERTVGRVRRVLEVGAMRRISDLSAAKTLAALAQARADKGLGQESVNHHVRAVKAFARWLWKEGRAREHYLAHLATSSPEGDRRRVRRALTFAEVARVLRAAQDGPEVQGIAGPPRALCDRMALGTGLRAQELATLSPERFRLDSTPPVAIVPAGYTKNGREASQPLPPGLVARLRPVLATMAPGEILFGLSRRTAEMLRVDLDAVGIPYETPEGFADFHSLRGGLHQ